MPNDVVMATSEAGVAASGHQDSAYAGLVVAGVEGPPAIF